MQFGMADLSDQRRTNRLVGIGTALAEMPSGTLPQAFPEWRDLKAAYRFFENPDNRYEDILRPHWQQTLEACRQPGEYLLIEDTTELDYTGHPHAANLGPIGNGKGRGLWVHSTLAVRVEQWDLEHHPEGTLVGLLHQKCWVRQGATGKRHQCWRQRMRRSRESQRWAEAFDPIGGPPALSTWIYMADRESDLYEPIERCERYGMDFIIRAYHDRALAGGNEHLLEAVARAAVFGHMEVDVAARAGQSARTATVEVRSCRVTLQGPWRPGGVRPDLALNVVEVREIDAPQNVEPLHWILLTSLSCERWVEVRRIIARYARRWWIEEYHKALKSGTKIEDSQMEEGYRLESLLAVLAVVAVRLLNLKLLARYQPNDPVPESALAPEAMTILEAKRKRPAGGWTNSTLLIAIARMGGFLARTHDGSPGWLTIWRGWQRLWLMSRGLEIGNQLRKRCG
jgi:hypothetical protein